MALASLGKGDKPLYDKVADFHRRTQGPIIAFSQQIQRAFKSYRGLAAEMHPDGIELAHAVHNSFVQLRTDDIESVFNDGDYDGIVLSGGSALNLSCNSQVFNQITQNIYIPPCCSDSGIAIGQLAVAIAERLEEKPECDLPYANLGETESEKSTSLTHPGFGVEAVCEPKEAARLIADGYVALAHVGRPENGPRALGHRSFLARPTREMRDIVSLELKQREAYRPVAPIVLESDRPAFFRNGPEISPYMLFTHDTTDEAKRETPGIVHHDGTARAQTVADDGGEVAELLSEVRNICGHSVLINTSLNDSGQPLMDTLEDTAGLSHRLRQRSDAKMFVYCR